MNSAGKRSRLKIFAWGALALGGLLLAWAAFLLGSVWVNLRNEEVRHQELDHVIGPAQASSTVGRRAAGRVVLDLEVGHFRVLRGQPGQPIRIVADYDVNSYALEARVESADDGAWLYRVTFREIGWLRDGGLRSLFGGAFPEVQIFLPPDVPLALDAHFGKGYSQVDLGGLWLTEIDLDLSKGGSSVNVSRPLVEPVEVMRIHGAQGSLQTRSLGNASPRRLEIDHRFGAAALDLRGQWMNDSEIRIRGLVGSTELILPDNVRVEGLRGSIAPRSPELPLPTLRIEASNFIGDLDITDR